MISITNPLYIDVPGKFGAIFAAVPQPIVAAIFCILFSKIGTIPLLCKQSKHQVVSRKLISNHDL